MKHKQTKDTNPKSAVIEPLSKTMLNSSYGKLNQKKFDGITLLSS